MCYRHRVLGDWAAILIFMLIAALIAGTLLAGSIFAASLIGRSGKRVAPGKARVFESGVSTGHFEPSRFSISYYLTAMLFIIFDIETVFLYPLAVQLRQLALFGLVELLLFVALLGIGYLYIWRKGALEWK